MLLHCLLSMHATSRVSQLISIVWVYLLTVHTFLHINNLKWTLMSVSHFDKLQSTFLFLTLINLSRLSCSKEFVFDIFFGVLSHFRVIAKTGGHKSRQSPWLRVVDVGSAEQMFCQNSNNSQLQFTWLCEQVLLILCTLCFCCLKRRLA